MIDKPQPLGPFDVDRLGGEDHLLYQRGQIPVARVGGVGLSASRSGSLGPVDYESLT